MLYANGYPVGGGGGGGSTEIIADDFDATSTYTIGDYVVYDGKLYKCTTAVSTAGQWDANDWTETIVMDEVGQGVPAVHYSTDEQVIGTWIDGKTLYEKTYIGGVIPSSSNLNIPIITTNVDFIFISEAVAYSSSTGFSLTLNDVIPTDARHSKRIYIDKTNSKIVIDNGDADSGIYDKSYVTVRYTKSS